LPHPAGQGFQNTQRIFDGLAVLVTLELLKPNWRWAQRGAATATPTAADV
jgi:hypothetical protein